MSSSKGEKTMSSRLLTMKFMQRAAATAAAKESPQTPTESSTPTPKRQRLTPTQSPAGPSSDLEAISAALAAEEDKRREALSRQAAEAGETEWVLDYGAGAQVPVQPMVVAADSLDADDEDMVLGGRQAYGNFKRKKKTTETPQKANEESDSDEEGSEEDEDDVESMINKAKTKTSSKKEKSKPQPRRVKLSQLSSISGGRHGSVGGGKSQKKRKHK
ncbi:hypothetical protein HFD88_009133 [Aspergillus terreus]|nr:hypothetical protein HFD88_009133 [Aspergillus terreus]